MLYCNIFFLAVALFAVFLSAGKALPEAWVSLLDNAGIILGLILACLTSAAGLYALFSRERIRQWFRRPVFLNTGESFQIPEEKVRAIVIPVSRREQPEWILRHLKPEFAGLLYTEKSRDIALQLARDFTGQCRFVVSLADIENRHDMLDDPDDPARVKEMTRKFVRQFMGHGIPNDKIFVDTTGGKVPMSIGAFQAAEEEGVSSIYISGTVDGMIKDAKNPEHGRPIFLSDRTG